MEKRSQHLTAEALGTGEVEMLRLRPASKHSLHELNPKQQHHWDNTQRGRERGKERKRKPTKETEQGSSENRARRKGISGTSRGFFLGRESLTLSTL